MTITVEVLNNKAYNLLSDMELLDLIRLNISTQTKPVSGQKLSSKFAGALKLPDTKYELYQKTLHESRNEWDRSIF